MCVADKMLKDDHLKVTLFNLFNLQKHTHKSENLELTNLAIKDVNPVGVKEDTYVCIHIYFYVCGCWCF